MILPPERMIGLALVAASVSLEGVGQLLLKQAANGQRRKAWFIGGGIACFVAEAIVWTLVLHTLELFIAFPMGSLSFVAVALLSRAFLQEKITRHRWIGITLITSGTAVLGLA